jgi:hypothetical protein
VAKSQLQTHGSVGYAVVLDRKILARHDTSLDVIACKYALRARFEDGERVEFDQRFYSPARCWLEAGDIVAVRYDPANRKKLEVDLGALKEQLAARDAERERVRLAAVERAERRLAEGLH